MGPPKEEVHDEFSISMCRSITTLLPFVDATNRGNNDGGPNKLGKITASQNNLKKFLDKTWQIQVKYFAGKSRFYPPSPLRFARFLVFFGFMLKIFDRFRSVATFYRE
jgi:hypothetical protein